MTTQTSVYLIGLFKEKNDYIEEVVEVIKSISKDNQDDAIKVFTSKEETLKGLIEDNKKLDVFFIAFHKEDELKGKNVFPKDMGITVYLNERFLTPSGWANFFIHTLKQIEYKQFIAQNTHKYIAQQGIKPLEMGQLDNFISSNPHNLKGLVFAFTYCGENYEIRVVGESKITVKLSPNKTCILTNEKTNKTGEHCDCLPLELRDSTLDHLVKDEYVEPFPETYVHSRPTFQLLKEGEVVSSVLEPFVKRIRNDATVQGTILSMLSILIEEHS